MISRTLIVGVVTITITNSNISKATSETVRFCDRIYFSTERKDHFNVVNKKPKELRFKLNEEVTALKELPPTLNPVGIRVFDRVQLDFSTGEVKLGDEVNSDHILQTSSMISRAVVEYSNGRPQRIRWLAAINLHENNISHGRCLQNSRSAGMEIQLNSKGRIQSIQEIGDIGYGPRFGETLQSFFVEAKTKNFSGNDYPLSWQKKEDSGSGFSPIYGNYRFFYDEKGLLVNSIVHSNVTTKNIYGPDQPMKLYDKSYVELKRSTDGLLIVFNEPDKISSFAEFMTVAKVANEKSIEISEQLKSPFVDAKQLTPMEVNLHQQHLQLKQESKDSGVNIEKAAKSVLLALSLQDPVFVKTKLEPAIERVRNNLQRSQLNRTEMIFQPDGKQNEFWLITKWSYNLNDRSLPSGHVIATRYLQSSANPLQFKITVGLVSNPEQIGEYTFTNQDEYQLKFMHINGVGGERPRLAVQSIKKMGTDSKPLTIEDKDNFKSELANIGLDRTFIETNDWTPLNLSDNLFHSSKKTFLGNLLESMVQGHPFKFLELMRPWHKFELNEIVRTGNHQSYNLDAVRTMARHFNATEIKNFLSNQHFPREEFMRYFLVGNGDHNSAIAVIKDQFHPKNIEAILNGQITGVLSLVPNAERFKAIDYFSILGRNPYMVPKKLLFFLDSKGRLEVAKNNLLKQWPKLKNFKDKEMADFLLEHFGLEPIVAAISSNAYKEISENNRRIDEYLNEMLSLLNASNLAQVKIYLLEIFPNYSELQNLDWTTIKKTKRWILEPARMWILKQKGPNNSSPYSDEIILPFRQSVK